MGQFYFGKVGQNWIGIDSYCYNLINEQVSMAGLVDVVRLLPQDLSTPEQVAVFRANHQGEHPAALTGQKDCNGYWRRIPGLALVE